MNASAQKGYFCFDEMFIWAKALLSQYPLICNGIAERFPFVIIDEVQDTNKQQGILLRKIFQQSSMPIMQRVGDANQAIYNYAGDIEDTELAFPQSGYHTIAKSFRFGQKIADLAAPVAATPILPTFVGAGPQRQDCITEGKHTVFIFPQADPLVNSYLILLKMIFYSRSTAWQPLAAFIGATMTPCPPNISPNRCVITGMGTPLTIRSEKSIRHLYCNIFFQGSKYCMSVIVLPLP